MHDMTYVSTHLYNVERGEAGWPKPIDQEKEKKEWLVDAVKTAIKTYGPLSTLQVYEVVKKMPGCPNLGCFYDYILAVIDRALRVSASQVWKIENI